MVSSGRFATRLQIAEPLDVTCIFETSPPMLWPTSTMCRSAGSVPRGSTVATACCNCSRRTAAESKSEVAVG